jgi:hypothetical protein
VKTRSKKLVVGIYACILIVAFCSESQTIKRGRNEGTISIPASNVMGSGNIDIITGTSTRYSRDGFVFEPVIAGQIGIADIMQINGQFTPYSKKSIGPVEAHLQITTPGNESLRFIGVAVRADLILSNTQDTFSTTSQTDKPEYNPYLFPSVIIDADWLSLWPRLPIKTYLSAGMVDNIELLSRYSQLYVKTALEIKLYRNSVYIAGGGGFYKEKQTKTAAEDKSYIQNYFWIEPGARYRLWNKISIVGEIKLAVSQKVKNITPLNPEVFNTSLRIEIPLFFRETNTEAIRTLIFMKSRKKETDTLEKNISNGNRLLKDVNASLLDLKDSTEAHNAEDEKETIKKHREETQQKMYEIEKLFNRLDKDETSPDSTENGKDKGQGQ